MSYFPKPSLNENDLAIIERGATAAHSIEAGQYVTWHGKTGKAKAVILQGATLSGSLFDYDEDGALNRIGIAVPGKTSRYIDELTVTTGTYTPEKTGWYIFDVEVGTNTGRMVMKRENDSSMFFSVSAPDGMNTSGWVFLYAGETYTYAWAGNVTRVTIWILE